MDLRILEKSCNFYKVGFEPIVVDINGVISPLQMAQNTWVVTGVLSLHL